MIKLHCSEILSFQRFCLRGVPIVSQFLSTILQCCKCGKDKSHVRYGKSGRFSIKRECIISALYLKKNDLTLKPVLRGKRCFASIITSFRYRFQLLWFLYRDIYFTLGTVSGTYRFSRWHFELYCRKAAPGTLERQQAVHAKNLMEWNEVYRLYTFKWNLPQCRSD